MDIRSIETFFERLRHQVDGDLEFGICLIGQLQQALAPAAHFTAETGSTQDPPTPDPAYEAALEAINRLPRIGVYDYETLVACLRTNYKLVVGDDAPLTDPQDMVQRLAAEVQNLRREKNA